MAQTPQAPGYGGIIDLTEAERRHQEYIDHELKQTLRIVFSVPGLIDFLEKIKAEATDVKLCFALKEGKTDIVMIPCDSGGNTIVVQQLKGEPLAYNIGNRQP